MCNNNHNMQQERKCSFPFPNGTLAPVTCLSLLLLVVSLFTTYCFDDERARGARRHQAAGQQRAKQRQRQTWNSRIVSYHIARGLFVILDHHCCCCCCRLCACVVWNSCIPEVYTMQPLLGPEITTKATEK